MYFNDLYLRLLMIEKEININDFAKALDVHRKTVSKWLNQKLSPNIYNIKKIAAYFNEPEDRFFKHIDTKKYNKYLRNELRKKFIER